VLLAPYYWRSEPRAILDHFLSVTEACGGQLIAYNNPKATNVLLTPDILEQLIGRVPGFVAIKDATFHMETFTDICELVARSSKDIAVYTGIEYLLTSIPTGGTAVFQHVVKWRPVSFRNSTRPVLALTFQRHAFSNSRCDVS